MAGKSQHFRLSNEEDEQLRGFEQSEHLKPKVRLRAQVVRLNAAGWSRRRIAQHTDRTYGTICQNLNRWHERGVDGLADAPATNQRLGQNGRYCACPPEKLTQEMRELVLEKLQEDRTWTCRQLVETVENCFGIKVSVEAMRKRVLELGYCWKRTRYVPCKEMGLEVEREHRASLETLKRGLKTDA
jgi:transposase